MGRWYADLAANGHEIGHELMQGFPLGVDENLEVRFLLELTSQPALDLFLGNLFAKDDVGPVLSNVDLGEVAR